MIWSALSACQSFRPLECSLPTMYYLFFKFLLIQHPHIEMMCLTPFPNQTLGITLNTEQHSIQCAHNIWKHLHFKDKKWCNNPILSAFTDMLKYKEKIELKIAKIINNLTQHRKICQCINSSFHIFYTFDNINFGCNCISVWLVVRCHSILLIIDKNVFILFFNIHCT